MNGTKMYSPAKPRDTNNDIGKKKNKQFGFVKVRRFSSRRDLRIRTILYITVVSLYVITVFNDQLFHGTALDLSSIITLGEGAIIVGTYALIAGSVMFICSLLKTIKEGYN